jgi:hypothetical protein
MELKEGHWINPHTLRRWSKEAAERGLLREDDEVQGHLRSVVQTTDGFSFGKPPSENTIRKVMKELTNAGLLKREKRAAPTRVTGGGTYHYCLTDEVEGVTRTFRSLMIHLRETRMGWHGYPGNAFELLRTPWARHQFGSELISSTLVENGVNVDDIKEEELDESLGLLLQCSPSAVLRFFDDWEPITEVWLNPPSRISPLLHHIAFDIISDLHACRDPVHPPFEIRAHEDHILNDENTVSLVEIYPQNEERCLLRVTSFGGVRLAVDAWFDSEPPQMIGDERGCVEIGGDANDVWAEIRWLEPFPSIEISIDSDSSDIEL